MYLDNGREIYESDQYPGYFIDANTGNFCDEEGHFIGGNIDNGDKPGGRNFNTNDFTTVYISKTGKQYYPIATKSATISISLSEAKKKGYYASRGYLNYLAKKAKRKNKKK